MPRRKRCRTSPDLDVAEGCNLVGIYPNEEGESSAAAELQVRPVPKVERVMVEGCSSVSKCSVKLIGEVVSKFNQIKRDLVKEIGFEAILDIPYIKQFNRKFTVFLMTSVSHRDATINVAPDISIKFDKKDIWHVLGVPAEGKVVVDPFAGTREAKEKVIQEYLGEEFREHRRIKILQEIIERDYGESMCKADSDRFKVAFVVFVVANLLAPSCKYGYASVDYWNAIKDPDEIGRYDWADFAFNKLVEGVAKLKQDIANNIKFPNITGCVLFLQVFYLDSLDMGNLSMKQSILPRVREFTFDRLRGLIRADKNFKRHLSGDTDISSVKLRNEDECIYSWALSKRDILVARRPTCFLSISEAVLAFVRSLKIPMEAVEPLCSLLSKFQDQVNSGVFADVPQASMFLSALASLIGPYSRGLCCCYCQMDAYVQDGNYVAQCGMVHGNSLMSYSLSISAPLVNSSTVGRSIGDSLRVVVERDMEAGVDVLQSQRSWKCSHGGPCFFGDDGGHSELAGRVDITGFVARTMAHCYGAIWNVKRGNDFDLNSAGVVGDVGCSGSLSGATNEDVVWSPWQLGYRWDFTVCSKENFLERIKCFVNDARIALVHRKPKYIQVSMEAMARQLMGKSEMELDLFDAFVRIGREQDDAMFSLHGTMRWRLFFESDFMNGISSGSFDLTDTCLHYNLCLDDSGYDLRQSKILFFPAMIWSEWVCFAWLPSSNIIWVFEPSYSLNVPEGRLVLIKQTCDKLKLALRTLCSSVFKGVCRDVFSADVRLLCLGDRSLCGCMASGLLCSMFYRCFDGFKLNPNVAKVDAQGVAAKSFNDLCELKESSRSFDCRV